MSYVLTDQTVDLIYKNWEDLYLNNRIRRCAKCILTETTPFIEFDSEGVCNYCKNYRIITVKGENELEKIITPFRFNGGKYNCIVSLTGGRDSSFGLHYVKRVLKMNPIAYTYDWATATDLARRNQERMCNALGVERIIVKSDENRYRQNAKMNIEAWLKCPDLGLIPILMAGDKKAIYYAKKVKKKTNIRLMFYCLGSSFEDCLFKAGFSNVRLHSPLVYCKISVQNKIKLGLYYLWRFMENPAFINSSLRDVLLGYVSLFFNRLSRQDIFLYHFIKWNEHKIIKTLVEEYGWELPNDTCLTWRIDDSTSAFYNYIYMLVAGFTGNDTFRSCQIREGVITRDEALKLVKDENRPRIATIEWYARLVGFDCNKAINIIHAIPRLYK